MNERAGMTKARAIIAVSAMLAWAGCDKSPPSAPPAQGDSPSPAAQAPASQSAGAAAASAFGSQPVQAVMDSLQILPLRDEIRRGIPRDPQERLRSAFTAWRTYEDAYLSFQYPDDESVRVRILGPDETFEVRGSVHTRAENTWFRCYLIEAGGRTLCPILLHRRDCFDDGICSCGAVVFRTYRYADGTLLRAGYLREGDIKKIQALGDGLRAVLFERTHLWILQCDYARIGLSVRLKKPFADAEAARRLVLDGYGDKGGLGLGEKGMTEAEVVALLGPPARREGNKLFFVQRWTRSESTYELELTGGRFEGLGDRWQRSHDVPPIRGTVAWIADVAEAWPEKPADANDAQRADVAYAIDRFCELAPQAHAWDWDGLCFAMHDLAEKGRKDGRVLAIIRARALDPNLRHSGTVFVLQEYDPQGSLELLLDMLEQEFTSPKDPPEDHFLLEIDETMPWWNIAFLSAIGKDAPPRLHAVIRAGMENPTSPVRRREAYRCCSWLSPADALPYQRKGLKDPDERVREIVAGHFADYAGDAGDLPLLTECARCETSEKVREKLLDAIERLRKKAEGPGISGDFRYRYRSAKGFPSFGICP